MGNHDLLRDVTRKLDAEMTAPRGDRKSWPRMARNISRDRSSPVENFVMDSASD
jgi:hypothetical protein